jgi:hypothetical protein
MARQFVNTPRHAAGIGSHCAPRDGAATSASRQYFCSCSCCRYHVVGLVAFSAVHNSFDPRRPAWLPATIQYPVCLRLPVLRRSLKTERDLAVHWSRTLVLVHDSVAITPRSSGAPRHLEWADLAEVRLRLDRYPQWLPVDFLPLRDHPCARRPRGDPASRIPRETRKSPVRHPSLRFGQVVRCDAPPAQ